MPEILEVELYRVLAEQALGRPIRSASLVDSRYGRGGTTSRRFSAATTGHLFTEARRRGKLLLLDTDGGPTVGIRFGMTGGLVVDSRQALDRLLYGPGRFDDKWVRARVLFEDGGHLFLHDPRRFGSVELAPDEERLGPDALSVTPRQLAAAVGAGAATLKARLLDQERVAGVGNLLADEILWRSGLAPGRRGGLSPAETARLHRELRATLRLLGRRGGSHTGDLMAQRIAGGRCPRDGELLRRETVGGRTTFWCPRHQM